MDTEVRQDAARWIGKSSDVRRGRWRTLRDAAVSLRRDSRTIAGRDEPVRHKLAHLRELVAMVGWYVADFSRPGTTAELRRELLEPR
jgi:hypothetical protein